MEKICTQCNNPKDVSNFDKHKNGLFGVRAVCKECRKLNRQKPKNKKQMKKYKAQYYIDNKEWINKKTNKHYHKNKKRILAQQKEWYEKNREEILVKSKKWRDEHKDIVRERKKEYIKTHPEIVLAAKKRFKKSTRGIIGMKKYAKSAKGRAAVKRSKDKHRLKWAYGLSNEDKAAMYIAQHNKCAICQKELLINKLGIDHCHHSGIVRGLLCSNCNRGIGLFQENEEIIIAALKYVQEGNFKFVHKKVS